MDDKQELYEASRPVLSAGSDLQDGSIDGDTLDATIDSGDEPTTEVPTTEGTGFSEEPLTA